MWVVLVAITRITLLHDTYGFIVVMCHITKHDAGYKEVIKANNAIMPIGLKINPVERRDK